MAIALLRQRPFPQAPQQYGVAVRGLIPPLQPINQPNIVFANIPLDQPEEGLENPAFDEVIDIPHHQEPYVGNEHHMLAEAPGVNRRRAVIMVEDEEKIVDDPYDHNSSNGSNRIYDFKTKYYAFPITEMFALFKDHLADVDGLAQVYFSKCVRLHVKDGLVALPADTVNNLLTWWTSVGFCMDNIPLSYVKAQECVRTLALDAESLHHVVMFSTLVAALHVREHHGIGRILEHNALMKGSFFSSRTIAYNYLMFRTLIASNIGLNMVSFLGAASVSCCVFGVVLSTHYVRSKLCQN